MVEETTQEEPTSAKLKRWREEDLKRRARKRERKKGSWRKDVTASVEKSQLGELERRYPTSSKEPPKDLPAISIVGRGTKKMARSPEEKVVERKGR